MSTRRPLVSIGVPVYNGERYLEQSLDSLLAQTYENLEIIISDNASTDQTDEICRWYAAKDSRIRYHRNDENLGHTVNTNQLVPMARGKYYRQHHDDDLMMPGCIEACVQALESDTKAVLAHTDTKTIDGSGEIIFEGDPVDYCLGASQPHARLERYMRQIFPHPPPQSTLSVCFALIRREALLGSPLLGGYPHSDRMMYSGLALYGTFAIVPEPLFLRRDHEDRSHRKMQEGRVLSEWLATSNRDRLFFLPRTEMFIDILHWIWTAPISTTEKFRCMCVVYRHYLRHYGANIVHYEPRAELSRLIKEKLLKGRLWPSSL